MSYKKYELGDICRISAGGDRPEVCSNIRTDATPVPIFSNGMENYGLYGYTDKAKIEGDVVTISARGVNVGTVCYRSEPFMPIVRLLSLIPNRKIVDAKYLYYVLKNTVLSGTGSAQPQITAPMIKKQEVLLLEEMNEQLKVADFLSLLDEKIYLNEKINDNLEQQAKLIFGEWINTCTDKCTISELSDNILDYTPIDNGTVRLLNSSDVTEGVFPVAPLVPNEGLKGHFKKRFKFEDILYSEIRPRNHHYGFVQFDASEYIASTRLMVIRAQEGKVSPAMLYQYLLLPDVEAEFTLKTESRSGTFPQGNYADMAAIVIPYAPIEKQKGISDTLTIIRQMIATNQIENQKLAELRDTLLPKLVSGELDVSDMHI